ncbi:MAG: sigma-70 family RNA polymerase sigma factor [Candidatus Doudnabacteria bacterium]|nr:sigma-70 family RNA polymerase sigma factor [bacterium]MDZ4243618.1 sigma-70 family RNA polymerase sigma factor [Candidatus Doudnabacteria bacterium]
MFVVSSPNKSEQEPAVLSELVSKAAKGDSVAFGQIYELYFEKVYRFIYYRTNHRQTAEDLVADTFVRVWNKISAIEDSASFNGWIYQIARNLLIDYYRSRKIDVDISTLENVLEYEDNIVDRANLSFQQKKFFAVLGELTSDEQLVIKLKFFDEFDNREIGEMLGKTEGAIRVIQHRAISELKELLNEDNEDEE